MEEITSTRRAPFGANPTVGEAGRATQLRILEAANDAFAANGYARTSVEAITDLAGCSRPTFYQYFSGKEDLHRRLAGRFGSELAGVLERMGPITPDRAGREEIHAWLSGLAAVYDRYQAVADNFTAAVRTDDQMVVGSSALSGAYRRRLCEVIVDPPPHPVPLELQASAINAVAYGGSVYRRQVGTVAETRSTDALADLIHRSVFGALPGVNLAAPRTGTTRRPAEPRRDDRGDTERRQSRGMTTRARLRDAAATAFGTLGYDAVRVDDIASEAGVSHGTFYRYYADKAAVFTEQVETATAEMTELVRRWPLAMDDEQAWAADYYEFFGRRGGIVACLPEAQAAGLGCAPESRRRVAFHLQAGLDGRGFGDTDADVVSAFALLESFASSAFRGLGISVDEAIGATALVLRRGVFGATA